MLGKDQLFLLRKKRLGRQQNLFLFFKIPDLVVHFQDLQVEYFLIGALAVALGAGLAAGLTLGRAGGLRAGDTVGVSRRTGPGLTVAPAAAVGLGLAAGCTARRTHRRGTGSGDALGGAAALTAAAGLRLTAGLGVGPAETVAVSGRSGLGQTDRRGAGT